MLVKCQHCGIEFNKKPADINRTLSNFCSRQCSGKHKVKKANENFHKLYLKIEGKCWPWLGAKNKNGYGVKRWQGKNTLSTRVMYNLAFGQFDESLCVLHKCDNPECVNPEHLFLGTHADNMRDMMEKGRGWSKLSHSAVIDIMNSKLKNAELAKRYNVSERTIRYAKSNRGWKHLPLPKPPESEV